VQTELIAALLLCLGAVCTAQDAPAPPAGKAKSAKAAPPVAAQDKGAAKPAPAAGDKEPAKGDAAEEAPKLPKLDLPPRTSVYTEFGYGDWGLGGSNNKFRQYATAPHGFFLRDLTYSPMLKSVSENGLFNIKGIGQDDYRAEARFASSYGATQASGYLSRFRFVDPLPTQVNPTPNTPNS